MIDTARCPCLTGLAYGECCGPLHRDERRAATAEQLMRSRYSAFAVGDAGYLLATWHPSTRPASVDIDERMRWVRLDIEGTQAGGPFERVGVVTFTAHWRADDDRGSQHETSSFVRDDRWLYVGEVAG